MIEIRPRETVILATNFDKLVAWYRDVLGFEVKQLFEDGIHYCNLTTPSGIEIGIGVAAEMTMTPTEPRNNMVILQFESADVRALFTHVAAADATIIDGPNFDPQNNFWYGAFADPEGNQIWVVDENCP